jgi:hypothetical protein
MTYREFCILVGHDDDQTRKQSNVINRCAYVHAVRQHYTLVELGDMMKRTHATILHYMGLDFRKSEAYHRAYQIAWECMKYQEVDNTLPDFDAVVGERNELRQRIAQKNTQISLLQEEIISLRHKVEQMKAVFT